MASLSLKKTTIGLPFRYKKDSASLFVQKFGMASLFVKKHKIKLEERRKVKNLKINNKQSFAQRGPKRRWFQSRGREKKQVKEKEKKPVLKKSDHGSVKFQVCFGVPKSP